MHIYDFQDKQNPTLLESIYLGMDGALSLAEDENTMYIYNHNREVTILDISGE